VCGGVLAVNDVKYCLGLLRGASTSASARWAPPRAATGGRGAPSLLGPGMTTDSNPLCAINVLVRQTYRLVTDVGNGGGAMARVNP
jgi:hypothetical protein